MNVLAAGFGTAIVEHLSQDDLGELRQGRGNRELDNMLDGGEDDL